MANEDQDLIEAYQQAVPTEPSPAPEPSASTEAPPVAEKVNAQEKAPVTLDDDVPVEFKVGGQVIRKPWKEILQTQALLPSDYTRKTQALAAERNSFQAQQQQFEYQRQQFEQERAALREALQDPRQLEAFYLMRMAQIQQQQGQAQLPPGGLAPINPAQLQQFLHTQAQHAAAQLVNQRFEEFARQSEDANRANHFESHVDKILEANPVLKALPGINDYLYGQVINMMEKGRTTVEEATGMLDTVAQAVAANLNQHYTQVKKETAVQEAQLKNGIEPKGGSPVLPAAKKYDRKKGLEDPELEQDVLAYLKAQLGA